MSGKDLVFTILGIDKGSPAFDKAGRSAEKFGDKLEKLGTTSIKAMAGVEAAGLASGAAIAGVIGGVPLLFGAVAAAAVAGNKEVRESFGNLADNVRDDVQSLAAPLAGEFLGVAEQLNTTFQRRVAPTLRMAFTDPALKQGIKEFTGGVTDLVSNSMPGFLTLLQRSQPVMKGFHSLLGDVGTGFTDFSRNISESSEGAGRVVTGLGRITSDALGDVGSLLAKLTDSVAPHMGKIEQIFDRATNSTLELATNALPILSTTSGAALGVLNSALGVLEPMSGTLGTVAGVSLAAAGGWRVLTGAGNAFNSLDLGGKLENTALKAGVMAESLTGSAVAGERVATAGSRLASVLRGVGSAIPIVGAAAIGIAMAIEASDDAMEASKAEARSWAEGLVKGGSEADRARLQLANLNSESASLQRQLDGMRASWDGGAESAQAFAAESQGLTDKIGANRVKIEETRKQYDDIVSKLTGAELAQVRYNEAVERYGSKSPEAAAAGAAFRLALEKEAEAARNAADAIKANIDRINERQSVMLGLVAAEISQRDAMLNAEQAQKAYTDAVSQHGAASIEARGALIGYETQLYNVVAAAAAKSRAENTAKSESDQVRLASEAEALSILQLAAAAGSSAPPALMSMVRGLDATRLAALGVTGRIDETGAAVYRLPDGKEIVVTGNTADAIAKLRAIDAYTVRDKSFYVTQINRISTVRLPSDPNAYSPGLAEGGRAAAGYAYTVGERGRELFVPDVDGTIVSNSDLNAASRGGGGNTLILNFYNQGVMGSKAEVQDWLVRSIDDAKRSGRL